jgi:hypothetical protein
MGSKRDSESLCLFGGEIEGEGFPWAGRGRVQGLRMLSTKGVLLGYGEELFMGQIRCMMVKICG